MNINEVYTIERYLPYEDVWVEYVAKFNDLDSAKQHLQEQLTTEPSESFRIVHTTITKQVVV